VAQPTPYYEDDHVTIYHGDCRELIPALTFDVVVTDPPYGMNLQSGRGGKLGSLKVANDHDTTVRDFVLAKAGRWPHVDVWALVDRAPRRVSDGPLLGQRRPYGMGDLSMPWKPTVEEIYVLGKGFVGHRGSCVLRYNAPAPAADQGRLHPTEKPVDLMRDLIGKCPPGVILDPFMGSGTTLRAAKDLGRKAIGIEIDERYCEIAARRMGQEVLF
jgi:DNA modification methylase